MVPNSMPSLFAKAKSWADVLHDSDKSGSNMSQNNLCTREDHSCHASGHDARADGNSNDLITFGQSEAFLSKMANEQAFGVRTYPI
jgi:hypothetical protein